MLVSVAGPEIVALVPRVSVAPVTVNVVLIVAAGAAAPTSRAKAKVENVRFIVFWSPPLLERGNAGKFGSSGTTTRSPAGGANLQSLPQARVTVHPGSP